MLWRIGCFLSCMIALGPTASCADDDLAQPEVARAIAENVWAMFDRIEDLQVQFRSTMRPGRTKGMEKLQRWDNGFYAYKRGGYELMRYDETVGNDGPIGYRYVLTPGKLAGFREDAEHGSRTGSVRPANELNFRLQWAPGHHLPLAFFHNQLRWYLTSGQYVVRLARDKDGDPELIAPVRAREAEEKSSKQFQQLTYVLTLSRQHGMSPTKIEWYVDQKKQVETKLDLFEAAPGIWLAEHGTCKQLVGGRDQFAHGVESEFWIEPATLKINSGVQVAFFNPEFPPGTRGMDHITKTDFTHDMKGGGQASDLKVTSSAAQGLTPLHAPQYAALSVPWTAVDLVVAGFGGLVVAAGAVGVVVLIRRGGMPQARHVAGHAPIPRS